MTSLTLSGDLGDSIVSLALARSLGIRKLNIVNHKSLKTNFLLRSHLVKPLMLAQDYIDEVEEDGLRDGYDVTGMRRFHDRSDTLLKMQVKELVATTGEDIPYDTSPWLKVEDNGRNKGKIAVARSPRYQNPRFPWKELVSNFGSRMVFIGNDGEYMSFCGAFGFIPWAETRDMLDVAKEIQSADLFIGNQSSPNAIAQGLGKDSILEVSDTVCDCIYARDNIQYVTDKPFTLGGRTFTPYSFPVSQQTSRLWETAFINAGVSFNP